MFGTRRARYPSGTTLAPPLSQQTASDQVLHNHERQRVRPQSRSGKGQRSAVSCVASPLGGGVQCVGLRRRLSARCGRVAGAGTMTVPRLETGDWFLVPEQLIRPSNGRQTSRPFATKSGRRPVILSGPGGSATLRVLPRSTRAKAGSEPWCFHERHSHLRVYPDCCIDKDGRIVYSPATIREQVLARYGPKCAEPASTGLLEQLERWE